MAKVTELKTDDDVLTTAESLRDIDSSATDRPFETETLAASERVRATLSALVAALPGEIRKATHLQRLLGIDYKICWQVFNVVRAPDLLTSAKHAPTAAALKRFLGAASQLGVDSHIVDSVRAASEKLGQVIKTHADNRDTFHSMVNGVSGADADADFQHRRAAYRAMSQIWGTQTDVHMSIAIVRRSTSGEGTDECMVTAKLGLRRLRPNVSLNVYGYRHHSSIALPTTIIRSPLDSESAKLYGAPLIAEFTSKPTPNLRTVTGPGGWTYLELANEGIGRKSAVDLTFGGVAYGVPYSVDTDGRKIFRAGTTFRAATGLHVANLLVHRPSFGDVEPELTAFLSSPGDESPAVARSAPQLPLSDKVVHLGRADKATATPDFARFPQLLADAARKVDWDLSEFDLFRARIEYPVLSTVIRLQFYFD